MGNILLSSDLDMTEVKNYPLFRLMFILNPRNGINFTEYIIFVNYIYITK